MRERDLIERLDKVIQAKGDNYKAVSLRAKLGETAVRDIIVGRVKNPGIYTLDRIARALDTTITQVMEETSRPMLRILSQVTEHGEIIPLEPNAPLDEVECPPGLAPEHVIAIRIHSDSMHPVLHKGWVVFYTEKRDIMIPIIRDGWQVPYNPPGDDPLAEFFKKPCVVKLKDGRSILRILKQGHLPGRYTLTSHNSPDIENVEIEWAAKIVYIKTG